MPAEAMLAVGWTNMNERFLREGAPVGASADNHETQRAGCLCLWDTIGSVSRAQGSFVCQDRWLKP